MGKGGKPKIEVTEYFMSEHFGVCNGPVDALLQIIVKEKAAWTGEQTSIAALPIDSSELFGGIKKEGGLRGTVHYLPGESDQLLPNVLAQKLGRANGADCPGFRGLTSLFFVGTDRPGFYWTANTPYLPGVWARVRRILKRSDGTAQWYPERAIIPGAEKTTSAKPFTLKWWQSSFHVGNNDFARMGLRFYDENGDLTGSTFAPMIGTARLVWTERTHSGTIPAGTAFYHVVQEMQRNEGANNDGYIDDISLEVDGLNVGIANSGAESGSTAGWTSTTGGLGVRGVDPAPHSGSWYFDGGGSANTSAYQQIGVGKLDMNPAHIIHECLTDTTWGMGTPAAALDDAAFTAAADVLYGESFGLSMMWTRQASIQDFVQEVLDHIQAVLFVDPSTGLLTLKLIRGDYDAETLPEINPDNANLSNFSRKLWGDIVNEIVVTWTNPENEQDETITAQDLASIATQGGVISDSRNYYGIRNATLAQQVAFRDLRSAGQPLASCEAEVDRTQWLARPASVRRVTWPEHGLSGLVMRVTSVDYGKPGDPTIKLQLIEDVYGLDIGDYDSPPSSEWEDPSALPAPLENVEIFTLPLFMAADTTVSAFVDSPEYPEVLAGVLATDDSQDTFSYELWAEVTLSNGSTEWQSLGVNNIIGRGEIVGGLPAEANSAGVTFENVIGQTAPSVAGFVIIGDEGEAGNEIAMVESIGTDYTLTRGVLDTVPRAWPAGTPAWFVDGNTLFEDPQVRSAGEIVEYKLLSRTSRGLLALDAAPLESATLSERPWLPNRPANVTAYGEAWSSQASPIDARERSDPWVTVTWANRNRLTEDSQVLSWTDSTVTPEDGQTTLIEVLPPDDDTPIAIHDGLSGTSFDVPDVSFGTEPIVRIRVHAARTDDAGDFVSLQYFEHWVQISQSGLVLEDGSLLLTEDGDRVILEG